MADKPKRGRPSKYTEALADKLCAQLAMGKSMRTVCKSDAMPSMQTVFTWLRTKPDFLEQYESAKAEAADALVDEMLDIADNIKEEPASRRVRVDTRKWISSKLKPKKYGDRTIHSGDSDNPLVTRIENTIIDP